MRKLTIKEIQEFKPCSRSWKWFKKHSNFKDTDKVSVLDVLNILDSPNYNPNVAADILWLLQNMHKKRIKGARNILLTALADITDHVLPIFEKEHPDNKMPRNLINAIRLYRDRKISKKKLIATINVANLAYASDAFYAVSYIADVSTHAYAVADAAYSAVYVADYDTDSITDDLYTAEKKWQVNLLRKLIKK